MDVQIERPPEPLDHGHRKGQTQHALPHGHVGEHVIEQVGGSTSGRAAVAAAKPREPAGEPATLQKVPELLLDEAGQPFPVAQAGGLRAKGLEVIVHDLVERTLRGMPRFVARRGPAIGGRHAGGMPARRPTQSA